MKLTSNNPGDSTGQEIKRKKKQKGIEVAKVEFNENVIKFSVAKGRRKKQWIVVKEIPALEIEKIEKFGKELTVTWNGVTDTFFTKGKMDVFGKLVDQVNEIQEEQRRAKEENEKANKRITDLSGVINASLGIVDLSFDVLTGLQEKRINWQKIEDSSKGFGENLNFIGETLPPLNVDLSKISLAVKSHNPKAASNEVYNVLKAVYGYFDGLKLDDDLKDHHPNFRDTKAFILAYFTLNDLFLGKAVGDKEIKEEVGQLEGVFQILGSETNFKVDIEQLQGNIDKMDLDYDKKKLVERTRGVFKEQLKQLQNPAEKAPASQEQAEPLAEAVQTEQGLPVSLQPTEASATSKGGFWRGRKQKKSFLERLGFKKKPVQTIEPKQEIAAQGATPKEEVSAEPTVPPVSSVLPEQEKPIQEASPASITTETTVAPEETAAEVATPKEETSVEPTASPASAAQPEQEKPVSQENSSVSTTTELPAVPATPKQEEAAAEPIATPVNVTEPAQEMSVLKEDSSALTTPSPSTPKEEAIVEKGAPKEETTLGDKIERKSFLERLGFRRKMAQPTAPKQETTAVTATTKEEVNVKPTVLPANAAQTEEKPIQQDSSASTETETSVAKEEATAEAAEPKVEVSAEPAATPVNVTQPEQGTSVSQEDVSSSSEPATFAPAASEEKVEAEPATTTENVAQPEQQKPVQQQAETTLKAEQKNQSKKKQKGIEVAKVEVSDNIAKFYVAKGLGRKTWVLVKEIPVLEIEHIEKSGNELTVTWKETTYTFYTKEKYDLFGNLVEQVNLALEDQRKASESKEKAPEV